MNPILVHDTATFKPITLRRGVVSKPNAEDFAKWVEEAYKAFKGDPSARQYRKDIVIEHLDRNAEVIKQYVLRNCVPTFYEPSSEFISTDDSAPSVETLTFVYEGFEEVNPKSKSIINLLINDALGGILV
jgi:phage tail-like protein